MQCVILAGGLATRMRPLTETIPKALIPVGGRPFIDHQLAWLAAHGVTDVVLSVGYRGEMLRDHVGDGARFGLAVRVVDEGTKLRGTAGALRLALDRGRARGGVPGDLRRLVPAHRLRRRLAPLRRLGRARAHDRVSQRRALGHQQRDLPRRAGRRSTTSTARRVPPPTSTTSTTACRRMRRERDRATGAAAAGAGRTASDLARRSLSRAEPPRGAGRTRGPRALLRDRLARGPAGLRAMDAQARG